MTTILCHVCVGQHVFMVDNAIDAHEPQAMERSFVVLPPTSASRICVFDDSMPFLRIA